jgi:hypothetical protein
MMVRDSVRQRTYRSAANCVPCLQAQDVLIEQVLWQMLSAGALYAICIAGSIDHQGQTSSETAQNLLRSGIIPNQTSLVA